jgi:hypothetical protein
MKPKKRKAKQKQQQKQHSVNDLMIDVTRALSPEGGREIDAGEFRLAAGKVGHKHDAQLRWAIGFAQQAEEKMGRGDWYNAIIETAAFLRPELALSDKDNTGVPFSEVFFASEGQVRKIKQEFLVLVQSAVVGKECSFEVEQCSVTMSPAGISYNVSKQAKAHVEQAKLRLAQLLGEHWNYVALCDTHRDGCGRYFLRSRKDQEFCSKTCLSRSTTYRARRKEPAA